MSIVPSFLQPNNTINNAVNSFFGTDSIDVLRNLSWAKQYLWTVDFIDAQPPAPFNEFFPASDITIPMAILEDETIPFGQTDIRIPVRSKSKEMSITFYDDEKQTLLNYFKEWIEIDIFNRGKYVSGMKDHHDIEKPGRSVNVNGHTNNVKPIRSVEVKMFDSYKKTVTSLKYGIFPVGQIDFLGSQASEATTYTVTFVIISELGEKGADKFSVLDLGKDLLGRFL